MDRAPVVVRDRIQSIAVRLGSGRQLRVAHEVETGGRYRLRPAGRHIRRSVVEGDHRAVWKPPVVGLEDRHADLRRIQVWVRIRVAAVRGDVEIDRVALRAGIQEGDRLEIPEHRYLAGLHEGRLRG